MKSEILPANNHAVLKRRGTPLVESERFELSTSGLQGQRSTKLNYDPTRGILGGVPICLYMFIGITTEFYHRGHLRA